LTPGIIPASQRTLSSPSNEVFHDDE